MRNSSIHAAAVVIADRPLTDIVPLQLADDRVVTQYSMKPIEEIGLLKMDFLGLRNLDVIEAALDIIEDAGGERPDMTTLPLDDPKTYEMLQRGDSVGVFQFESDGMRDALRKVKPTEFNDLVALVALYRPGAMRYIDTYARNKRNPDAIEYTDERLRSITESTYGVILYQEQSMQIAKRSPASRAPRPTTCARRSARSCATRWRRSRTASSRAPAPAAPPSASSRSCGRSTRRPPTTPSTAPTPPATA